MRWWLLQIIFLLLGTNSQCQILDFSKKKPKVIPIPYDSSYYSLPDFGSAEEYEGLKGQRIIDSKGDIWILKDYKNETDLYVSDLTLVSINDGWTKTVYNDNYQDYYLEAGFEQFKGRLQDVKVYPFINQQAQFIAYNDVELLIEANEEYKITDVKYAKFELEEYAPTLQINQKGYYKLLRISDKSIILKGNATNNEIEFTFINQVSNRDTPKRMSKYDDSGNGVFGRKIVKRNWRELFKGGNQSKRSGKIAVMICVDRSGTVKYTEILFDETTETDSKRLKQAMKAANGYRFQEDLNAPAEECGKLIF